MARLIIGALLSFGLAANAAELSLKNWRYIPVRTCRNGAPVGDPKAISFTILMDSRLCQIAGDANLDDQGFRSTQGNLMFAQSIMILDQVNGGLLPGLADAIIPIREWQDRPRSQDSKVSSPSFNACMKLDRVVHNSKYTENKQEIQQRRSFELSVQTDSVARDTSRGRYIPFQNLDASKYEELTCYTPDPLMLAESAPSSSPSVNATGEIAVPREEDTQPTDITPRPSTPLPPQPGIREPLSPSENEVPPPPAPASEPEEEGQGPALPPPSA